MYKHALSFFRDVVYEFFTKVHLCEALKKANKIFVRHSPAKISLLIRKCTFSLPQFVLILSKYY